MAKKTDGTDGAEGDAANAVAIVPAAPVVEAQPSAGGSFTRNADGTLTQTEGHRFAHDVINNQE